MKTLTFGIRLLLCLGAVTASSAWAAGIADILDAGTQLTPTGLFDVALADLDLDGDLDLIGAYGTHTLLVSLNDGTGAFVPTAGLPVSENAIDVTCGDLENDGDLDAMLTTLGVVLFLETLGDGTFQESSPLGGFVDDNITAAVVADLDGDSDLDLVTATPDGIQSIYVAMGNQIFPIQFGVFPAGPAPSTLELFDIDLDGDLDSLVASNQDSTLRILRNNGSGYFSPAQVLTTASPVMAMAIGDVDGDGRADVITVTGSLQPGSALALSFGYVSGKLAPVTLVAGLSQLSLPFKDGLLVPSPDVLVPLITDDSSILALVSGLNLLTTWPSRVPSGTTLALQFWAADDTAPQGF
ncbi:MAG: hypothetical protein ACI9EF_003107, partial [Pseudohongiellaceae bacterium]